MQEPSRCRDRRAIQSTSQNAISAEVLDRGAGIPREILPRIGEPFFTTKPSGQGMGLGIFLARTLAEQLGGVLVLQSDPASGTVASLRIPARPVQ